MTVRGAMLFTGHHGTAADFLGEIRKKCGPFAPGGDGKLLPLPPDHPFVFVVRSDPKPIGGVTPHIRQSTKIVVEPHAPEFAGFLPVQRWVGWIGQPECVSLSREPLHFFRERRIELPESRGDQ